MCYKAPGPRCSPDSLLAYEKSRLSLEQKQRELKALSDTKIKLDKRQPFNHEPVGKYLGIPEGQRENVEYLEAALRERIANVTKEVASLKAEAKSDHREWRASPHGLKSATMDVAMAGGFVTKEEKARYDKADENLRAVFELIAEKEQAGEDVSRALKSERKKALEEWNNVTDSILSKPEGLYYQAARFMNQTKLDADGRPTPWSGKLVFADKMNPANPATALGIFRYASATQPYTVVAAAGNLTLGANWRNDRIGVVKSANDRTSAREEWLDEPMNEHQEKRDRDADFKALSAAGMVGKSSERESNEGMLDNLASLKSNRELVDAIPG